jgi:hypothetical protein
VQTHAGNTKARNDVQRLLTDLGFGLDAIAALGLSRSPYIGIGGPVRLHVAGAVIDLSSLPGPHDIRLGPPHPITIAVRPGPEPLLIIENRQAAETLCDTISWRAFINAASSTSSIPNSATRILAPSPRSCTPTT